MTIQLDTPKAAVLAQLQGIIGGLQKRLPNGNFTIGNAPFTTAALIALFQELINAITDADTKQAVAKAAIVAVRNTKAKVLPVQTGLQHQLASMFAGAPDALADFGMTPRKERTPLTAAQRAAQVAKAEATRKARGTTGKKKKLAVKGNVTGVVVTPVTAPEPTPAPPAQTAPIANVAGTPAAK